MGCLYLPFFILQSCLISTLVDRGGAVGGRSPLSLPPLVPALPSLPSRSFSVDRRNLENQKSPLKFPGITEQRIAQISQQSGKCIR